MPPMTLRRAFWIFALFTVLTTVADRILFIILPLYLIRLDFSATEIGLAFTGAAIILALFRFLVGKLSDLRGRKGILSLGLLVDSVATALYPLASTVAQFSVIKGIKDAAFHGSSVMSDALQGDAFPRESRTRYLSRLGTIFPMGRALAALIGFMVVTYLSVAWGFHIAAISLFLAFLAFTLFFREERPARAAPFRFSLRNIPKPLLLVSLISLVNAFSLSIAYYPGVFVLADSLGLGEADLFLMYLASYVISILFAWRTEGWMMRHGKEALLGLAFLGFGSFTWLYAFAKGPMVFFLALLGVAISFYVWRICFKISLLDSTDDRRRGEQVGFQKMVSQAGFIAGPTIGGLLIDQVSLQSAFLVSGSLGILGFSLAMWLRRMMY